MLKRSLKYLVIAVANFAILTILLALWTDRLELLYSDWVRPLEFLKIVGFSFASLIGMKLLVDYCQKQGISSVNRRIKLAVLITFLISSYLYYTYTSGFISNRIINRVTREKTLSKIEIAAGLAHSTKAANLTISEYREVAKITGFPKLPDDATNINYAYQYDGFLPDYSYQVIYDLPGEENIDTVNEHDGRFSNYQAYKIVGNKKRVTHEESRQ